MGEAAAVQKTSLNLSSTRQPLRGPLSGSSPGPPAATPAAIFSHFAPDVNARSSKFASGLDETLLHMCTYFSGSQFTCDESPSLTSHSALTIGYFFRL